MGMARLVVNPGTEAEWEVELLPGVNTFGRGDDNHFPIEHESVSSSHCQITVSGGRAILKDLGSVNGTYVENELVETAVLRPGQRLRMGDVEMVFDPLASNAEGQHLSQTEVQIPVPRSIPNSPALVVSPASARVAAAGGRLCCKYHPRESARFVCSKCGQAVCEMCVNIRETGAGTGEVLPHLRRSLRGRSGSRIARSSPCPFLSSAGHARVLIPGRRRWPDSFDWRHDLLWTDGGLDQHGQACHGNWLHGRGICHGVWDRLSRQLLSPHCSGLRDGGGHDA